MKNDVLKALNRPCMRSTLAAVVIGLLLVSPSAPAAGFGFDDVTAMAQKLALEPYQAPQQVPRWLRDINYDQWRDIRFRPAQSLWRSERLPFEVQFFHPGLYYDRSVAIDVVDGGRATPLAFSKAAFDYGGNDFQDKIPDDLGFAGFRLHAPIKTGDYYDEVAVFLGASYFRAVGKPNVYGLSARGLAIDTAAPSGEEFPWFRRFWLVKPKPGAVQMIVYALLDGPSVVGAYKFTVTPGEDTVVDVDSVLFPRKPIAKLGIAPLTSMFFYGENDSQRPVNDFRPEIHDSDGLLIAMDHGEWLWRPLSNPKRLSVNSFAADNPRGFGLLQRDVDFDHYLDLEARYDLRPSAWIVPRGAWGEGAVELIQIPTPNELNDNIVAFWVPKATVEPGKPLAFAYRMSWFKAGNRPLSAARVTATRIGNHHASNGENERIRNFVIEFQGGELDALPAEAPVEAVVDVGAGGALVEQQVMKNPATGGWRLVFGITGETVSPLKRVLDSGDGQPLELRAFLRRGGDALTETWSYALQP